jgi:hypothetical protein
MDLAQQYRISDLQHKQEELDMDSAPFIVDNLTSIARGNISGLKTEDLKALLPDSGVLTANNIREKHSIIEDRALCYGEFKLCKILEFKTKGIQVSIIPVNLESETAGSLITKSGKIITALENDLTVLVPIYLHGSDWAGLTVKKFYEDGEYSGVRIIYTDPSGSSINDEEAAKNFISCISNCQADINVIDIKLKQETTSEESCAFVVENLVILASHDNDNLGRIGLVKFIDSMVAAGEGAAETLRQNHTNELCQAYGIPEEYMPIAGAVNEADFI